MRIARRITLLAVLLCALAAPATAHAGSSMYIGAVENAPLQADLVSAKAKVDLARLAGLDALRIGVFWGPGKASMIPPGDLQVLQNAAAAAQLNGIRLIVSVSNYNSRNTPNTQKLRDEFAIFVVALARALPSVSDFIIGNEPNLNLFWMPQFAKPQFKYVTKTKKVRVKGKLVTKKVRVKVLKKIPADLAAIGYQKLLAQTYDYLKAVDPTINVIGVALSPRGTDNPLGKRPTHSPTTFLRDLGAAYRASGRTKPIMDAFAIHPYLENSKLPPSFAHPKSTSIGLADYNKLVKLLADSFKGTAQPGATLPIVYDEFGTQTRIPASKTQHYTNLNTIPARDVVSEATQAAYYRQAIQIAYCQPNAMGLLFFHVSDEFNAKAWQSGLFYADDTPKTSMEPVKAAIEQAHAGTLTSCATNGPTDSLQTFSLDTKETYTNEDLDWTASVNCQRMCTYSAKIEKFPSGEPVLQAYSDVEANTDTKITFPREPLAPGQYRMVVRVWVWGKLGTSVIRYGKPFTVAAIPPPPPPPPPPPAG